MFPPDSNASCGRRNSPLDISAPDIPYTAEDDEAINKYIRLNGELCSVLLDRDLRHVWLIQSPNDMAFSKGWMICHGYLVLRLVRMGTCSMKPRDRGGVVDSALSVYGIRNLNVAAGVLRNISWMLLLSSYLFVRPTSGPTRTAQR